MEKSTKAAVVPVTFRWSDVGSWGSLDEVASKDKTGNVVVGRVVDIDSQRSIVYGDRRVVATIGLKDMVVVIRLMPRLCVPSRGPGCEKNSGDSQATRCTRTFRASHRPSALGFLYRPRRRPRLQGEACQVKPGGRLSLQMHHKRSEHWVVITGTARVTRGDEVFDLQVGHSTGIPWKRPIA
jgi:Mannose-1-phosphate guanylyltransferase